MATIQGSDNIRFGKFKGQKTLDEILEKERSYAEHISGWSNAETVLYHY